MVSHWLLTTQAHVEFRSINLEFLVDKMALGLVFSMHSSFPFKSVSVQMKCFMLNYFSCTRLIQHDTVQYIAYIVFPSKTKNENM